MNDSGPDNGTWDFSTFPGNPDSNSRSGLIVEAIFSADDAETSTVPRMGTKKSQSEV